MQKRLTILFIIVFSSVLLDSSAQGNKKISINFQSASIEQVVKELEALSPYHFFYDSHELDSASFTFSATAITIPALLGQLFNNSPYHFSIDSMENRIFVTKKYIIQTALPNGFWDRKKEIGNTTAADNAERPAKQINKLKEADNNKLFEIGVAGGRLSGKATLAGYIRDAKTGEPIYGATVSVDTSGVAVTTDQFGYYSLTMNKGRHSLTINSATMKESKRQIILYTDGKLDVELRDNIVSLKAIVVASEKRSGLKNLQMGVAKLSISSIKQVPVIFGETDILRVVLALPGVTSVGEASTGFNVRGGSSDQNLILFNDATIYNPSHLFGFFSAFNADVVKGIELYKSAIPEKYGGRLSSVLDVAVKDGNAKQWTGTAGIGPLTSKFMIEGPLKKERSSIIFSGRTTYSDWLLHSLKNIAYNKSNASFYDLNLHTSSTLNASNSIYITGYISNDHFSLNKDTSYQYSNRNANIKWKHIFNNKFNAVTTVGADHYQYAVSSTFIPVNGYKLGFDIGQQYIHADLNYALNNTHNFSFGASSILYQLHPGSYEAKGPASLVIKNTVQQEQGLESAIYFGDQIKLTSKLSLNAGLRYSLFNYLGAHEVNEYATGQPRTTNTITGTSFYTKGKSIATYHGPEIRVAMRYSLTDDASVKLSYNTLRQYIHMLSNTTAISPTDTWKLSDSYTKPQDGQQLSFGLYKNFRSNSIETSLELYYKKIKNYLDYKSGASLVLNHHIETETINTRGKAYGIELLLKKTTGRLNGWLSYAYSKTFLQQDDQLAGEIINKGDYYPASFDKPHSVNFIGNYRFSHRYSISTNIVYSTGRPITLPLASFTIGGATSLYYSERNAYRVPDYFRVDLSGTFEGNHKIKQRIHNSWSAGVYNLLARQNAYSVYFVNENGKVRGYQLSIFGTAIPFITYNMKF
jgi:hypothetical protein